LGILPKNGKKWVKMTQKWSKMGKFGVFPSFIFEKNGKFM